MSVLVVGSIGIDGIKTAEGEANEVMGGSASYAAIATSFLSRVHLLGVVGEDFPEDHRRVFESRDIDLEGLEVVKGGKTFRWVGQYEEDMNNRNTLAVDLNVLATFNPQLPESYKKAPVALLANGTPDLQLSVLSQMNKPMFSIADTMDLWINIARDKLMELLTKIDLLILNDSEAKAFSGEKNLVKAAAWILSKGPKYVVIKKGEHGALLTDGSRYFLSPAFPLDRIVDPTGAGDTFVGGLAGTIAREGNANFDTLKKGIINGTVIASFTCEDYSLNRLKAIATREIEERVARLKVMMQP